MQQLRFSPSPLPFLTLICLSLPLLQAVEVVAPPAPLQEHLTERIGGAGLQLPSPFWQDPWWDDGLAEVSSYELQQARYGKIYAGEGTLIAVRESMDPQRAVKSTDGSGIPVIKAMLQRHFQTGNYPYHQSATTLISRDTGIPQRYLMSTMEWCGNAGKSWVNQGTASPLRVMSYFDGHGDLEQALNLGDNAVLADTLWLWTRAWVAAGQPALPQLHVVDSQIEAKTVNTSPRPATITAIAGSHGGGLFSSATPIYTVTISRGENGASTDTFIIEQQAPYKILTWTDSEGSVWTLKEQKRFAYWNR